MTPCCRCSTPFEPRPWQIADRYLECAPCRNARKAMWRAARKAEGRPVVSGKMSREYHRAYEAAYFQDTENRERRNARIRSYAKAHGTKERHDARAKVRRALDSGRITRRPCEVCGAEKVHAHHEYYSKPLDVRWLCHTHHYEHHAKATRDNVGGV